MENLMLPPQRGTDLDIATLLGLVLFGFAALFWLANLYMQIRADRLVNKTKAVEQPAQSTEQTQAAPPAAAPA